MPPITDPRVIRFCNQGVRPVSERLRSLFSDLDDLTRRWDDEIGALVPNTVDVVDDGRADEGISTLEAREVRQFIRICERFKELSDGDDTTPVTPVALTRDKVNKACVRTLKRTAVVEA